MLPILPKVLSQPAKEVVRRHTIRLRLFFIGLHFYARIILGVIEDEKHKA